MREFTVLPLNELARGGLLDFPAERTMSIALVIDRCSDACLLLLRLFGPLVCLSVAVESAPPACDDIKNIIQSGNDALFCQHLESGFCRFPETHVACCRAAAVQSRCGAGHDEELRCAGMARESAAPQ